MPHFSKANHTQQTSVRLTEGKQYRLTGYINMRTPWNDNLKRFEQMSAAQKQTCDELYRQMAAAGAELSITIWERTEAIDVREFPRVLSLNLYTNTPREQPLNGSTTETEQKEPKRQDYGLPPGLDF